MTDGAEARLNEPGLRTAFAGDRMLQSLIDRISGGLDQLEYDPACRCYSALPGRYERCQPEPAPRWNDALERRVAERTAQLEALNQDLESFSYTVSHDLRAPVRRVEGFLDHLAQHLAPHLDDTARLCLDRARAANQRMGGYIDALLEFSRLGRQPLEARPVDLAALVAEVVEEFQLDLAGRRVAWEIGPLPVVRGDASLVRAVFQNLVGNALKFTRPRAEARIRVALDPSFREECVVAVADNGVGFDPAHARKLFGVFQRLHPEGEFEGSGVGLASVQRIISRHGGRVWATGRPDRGATFFLAFPEGWPGKV
jgi:light-regulated signal transduction histidine kinase (bacteriophytochrome)